jgi:hypothetical protein
VTKVIDSDVTATILMLAVIDVGDIVGHKRENPGGLLTHCLVAD